MKRDISSEHYKAKYQGYVSFEDIIADEYKIIGRKIAEFVSQKFKGKISCLDVGCGTGRMPNTLVKLLEGHGIDIIFDYMDPATESLEIYGRNVNPTNRGRAINTGFADFESDKEYDLLLANNSLCGYDLSSQEAVRKLLLPVNEGGIAIITLPSNESDWVRYANMFWETIHGDKPKKTRFESLLESLNRYGIEHQTSVVNAPVTLNPDNLDQSLQVIFNVMLYSDPTSSNYESCFREFKEEVLQKGELNFVYGIASVEK
ncbi:MAG: class I SAM-dependent methyltransferase [Candidatus Heimdallarchaeaceae archaeon]